VCNTCSITDALVVVRAAADAAVDAVSVFGTAWLYVSDVAFTLCSSVRAPVDWSICRRSPQMRCLLCSVRLINAQSLYQLNSLYRLYCGPPTWRPHCTTHPVRPSVRFIHVLSLLYISLSCTQTLK